MKLPKFVPLALMIAAIGLAACRDVQAAEIVQETVSLCRDLRQVQEAILPASPHLTTAGLRDQIQRLDECLAKLAALDDRMLTELRAEGEPLRVIEAEQHLGVAWLHAWAALGTIADRVSRHPAETAELRQLVLGLKSQPTPLGRLLQARQRLNERTDRFKAQVAAVAKLLRNNLPVQELTEAQDRAAKVRDALRDPSLPEDQKKNLEQNLAEAEEAVTQAQNDLDSARRELTDYEAWARAAKATSDPLVVRLGQTSGLSDALGPFWWDDQDRKYRIPTTADLLGPPAAEESVDGVFSLWAVVNRQLDTFHAWASPAAAIDDPQLDELSCWLTALSRRSMPSLGDAAFCSRLDCLASYLKARQRLTRDDILQEVVQTLVDRRRGVAQDNSTLTLLIDAALPVMEETLPDARIWLRYLLLLSYQREGAAGTMAPGATSLEAQWQSLLPDGGPFFLAEETSRRPDHAIVRWGKWPAEGDATHHLADLTRGTYAYFHHQRQVHMLQRSGLDDREHSIRLQTALRDLQLVLNDALPITIERETGSFEVRTFKLAPSPLWNRTGTAAEQWRLQADRADLLDQLRVSVELQMVVIRISQLRGGQVTVLGDVPSLVRCDITQAPSVAFDTASQRLAGLASQLSQQADAERTGRRLLQTYRDRQAQCALAELDGESSALIVAAAEKSLKIAQLYQQIAELDIEIRGILERAAAEEKAATANESDAAERRLRLATRARDLAEAQVEALSTAVREAPKVIEQALASLNELEFQLRVRARQIEDEQRRAFVIGLIKSVVRIVGAVLAPFTSGASLGIAMAVTSAIDLVDSVDRMKWDSLGAVVNNVGKIAEGAEPVAGPLISAVGGESLQKDWADLKTKIQDVKDQIKDVGGEARNLLQNIEGLDELVAAVNSAANSLPVRLEDGKLIIPLDQLPSLTIQDPRFAEGLRKFLKSGGIVAGDLEKWSSRLSQLPVLNDKELRRVLAEEWDNFMRSAPPEVLERYRELQDKAAGATASVESASDALKALLLEDGPGAAPRRELLARILQGGLVLMVTPKGDVIAVAKDLSPETARFRQRLAIQTATVVEGEIGDLVKNIQALIDPVTRQIDAAESAQDPAALNKLADNAVALIPRVQEQIQRLHGRLIEAQSKFDDAQGELEQQGLLKSSADSRRKIADERNTAAQFETRKSGLVLGNAFEQRERDALLLESQKTQNHLKRQSLAQLIEQRDVAHAECIAFGINPEIEGPFVLPAISSLRLGGVFAQGRTPQEVWQRSVLREMASEFTQLLRWQRMFHLTTVHPGEPKHARLRSEDWLKLLIQKLDEERPFDQQGNDLQQWGKILEHDVASHAAEVDSKQLEIRTSELQFADPWQRASDVWLMTQPDPIQRSLVARIDLPIGDGQRLDPQLPGERDDLIAVQSRLAVLRAGNTRTDVSNLRFLVVSPEMPLSRPAGMVVPAMTFNTLRDVASDGAGALLPQLVEQDLGNWRRDPKFVGLYGMWSIYLLDTRLGKEISENERMKILSTYRNELELSVWIPYLRVRSGN